MDAVMIGFQEKDVMIEVLLRSTTVPVFLSIKYLFSLNSLEILNFKQCKEI